MKWRRHLAQGVKHMYTTFARPFARPYHRQRHILEHLIPAGRRAALFSSGNAYRLRFMAGKTYRLVEHARC